MPHFFYSRSVPNITRKYSTPENKNTITTVKFDWDEEGRFVHFKLTRSNPLLTPPPVGVPDPISIELDTIYGKYHYVIDGRDLCYAVAKGCTEALKKYGFQGYKKSTSGQYSGDNIDINMLLFVKAYALDAWEARDTQLAYQIPDGWHEAYSSSFEKEMELLLFDM